jgi:hypothetical protein
MKTRNTSSIGVNSSVQEYEDIMLHKPYCVHLLPNKMKLNVKKKVPQCDGLAKKQIVNMSCQHLEFSLSWEESRLPVDMLTSRPQ